MKHYFIAIALDKATKAWLYEIQKQLIPWFSYKHWVEKDDFHITLHFFGAIEQETLTTIADRLEKMQQQPFVLKIGGLSYFGLQERPRVLWMQMESNEALQTLHEIVQTIIGRHIPIQQKHFIPHITIAKKWADPAIRCSSNVWNIAMETKQVTIDTITIYEIHPDKRPRYQVWKSFTWDEVR
ncbi:RNA 2',3'-cyclic phosphodiesterase [Gracilibacillus alcaliphilus]|uniref:RNA 2',3'-cyclic phosphodiesterase n=1 Tax=Gracilibacillus alcaliphilus TaxID=1401441 RepID=UPI0019560087|nr:RNA 2',3'-cyclic phosphodiesterase [Gracilibacillus alcaliphilus]MBM7679477.1 2'-5' RNA ligase [Gracilibacillus alcaliphilus]